MPNAIKYSTSGVTNTIKKNNIVLGVNNIGYGPTPNTGFWMGIDAPTNGYTVYSFPNSATTPTAVVASNDSDLISIAKSFGAPNIVTVANALQYFASGSPINLVTNKQYPNIVTSGLTYLFDAGFVTSYPTAGSVWYDLSGNAYDGSLVNGPTYSASTLSFDGTDDYMTLPNGITLNGANTMLFTINGNYQNYYLSVFERNSVLGAGLTTAIPQNGWVQVGYIWDGSSNKFIINGTIYNANTGGSFPYDNPLYRPLFWAGNFNFFGSNSSPNLSFHLQNNSGGNTGFLWSGFTYKAINITATAGNRRYFSGNTANISIYNRALSSAEVIQNYEAYMNQYGTLEVQYLVVAGGGSGGYTGYPSGGGGAGGLLTGATTSLSKNTNYTVTVGAGGSASNGSNSRFNAVTSTGGGRGGNGRSGGGATGGSGGGGASNYPADVSGNGYLTPAGSGTTGQGFAGGVGKSVYGDTFVNGIPTGAGGGGGAGGVGGTGTTNPSIKAGNGGVGLYISEYVTLGGSPSGWFAGGGGGSTSYSSSAIGAIGIGGNGGGGNGSYTQFSSGPTATAGSVNTGGGGGGAGYEEYTFRSGGSGIVILRIPDVFTANFSSGVSSSMTRTGGYKYYKITATSTTSETVNFS
jgi:hypothetical protein